MGSFFHLDLLSGDKEDVHGENTVKTFKVVKQEAPLSPRDPQDALY